MKQYILGLLFLAAFSASSQTSPSNFWNDVRFGGGIGLGFSNGYFNGSIAPSAIYQINEQFATGVSLNFNYAKFDDDRLLAYGGSILSLYNPIPFIQLSTEWEQLRVNRTYALEGGDLEDNYWSPALFLGIGYSNRNVTFGLRYDVLYDDNKSIYTNALMPFVRLYF
ncbi:MAG: alpha-ketoglutarate decarboxylase [Maribacter sp.]|uniref:alpha-ketoglutarate decarboxylase n=1 Tax=Maribacter sp. TaxID=1897614 RepID=UPI003C7168E3